MTSAFNIDDEAIRKLANILVETKLTEIEYEDDGRRIRVSKGSTQAPAPTFIPAPAPAPAAPQAPAATPTSEPTAEAPTDFSKHPGAIKSPMVGTAYMSPEPGAATFVKVGDTVNVGQTLMIIEAMKVMNPIKAPRAGKVTHVMARDTLPVEYGEVLMIIEG